MLAAWHDAQQGGCTDDLPIWCNLARELGRDVLELGAGTGRVALHVARETGRRVWALDHDPELLDDLAARALDEDLPVRTVFADALDFRLSRRFDLICAPVSFVQIIGGRDERRQLLDRVREHLQPDGLAALSVMDLRPIRPSGAYRVRRDGHVYSSAITNVDWLAPDRLRLTWSRVLRRTWRRGPRQVLEPMTIEYAALTEHDIETEAARAGLTLIERLDLPASEWAPECIYVLRRGRNAEK